MKRMNDELLESKKIFQITKILLIKSKRLFDIFIRNIANLGEQKKIRVFYLSFPKILSESDQIHPDGTQTFGKFPNDVLNKINF